MGERIEIFYSWYLEGTGKVSPFMGERIEMLSYAFKNMLYDVSPFMGERIEIVSMSLTIKTSLSRLSWASGLKYHTQRIKNDFLPSRLSWASGLKYLITPRINQYRSGLAFHGRAD